MPQVKELLIEELQDLLHAETQLTAALPKMADAAKHFKLKEAFRRHHRETQVQIERLKQVIELLGQKAEPKTCKAMKGLIEEGEQTIADGVDKEALAADLALIAAAQKVEHYEIASYGTAHGLARQLGEIESARLLAQTLGEEQRTDFMLTAIADPLLQQAMLDDVGGDVNLNAANSKPASKKAKATRAPTPVS